MPKDDRLGGYDAPMIATGKKDVGTTAVQLPNTIAETRFGFQVTASESNAASIYVGPHPNVDAASTDALSGIEIAPGASLFVPHKTVWAISTSGGQVLTFMEF